MSAAEELDYEVDDPELPPPPRDEVSLQERIDWNLNRIRWYRRKIAEQEQIRDRMVARYEMWLASTTERWREKVAQSEAWIEQTVHAVIDADPDGPKTWHLPSGTVRSNPARPKVEVDDVAAFEAWVSGQADPRAYASWTCHPDKVAVRKQIEETGELIPGVRVDPGRRSVSIKPDETDPF